jgi:hypothetical protein
MTNYKNYTSSRRQTPGRKKTSPRVKDQRPLFPRTQPVDLTRLVIQFQDICARRDYAKKIVDFFKGVHDVTMNVVFYAENVNDVRAELALSLSNDGSLEATKWAVNPINHDSAVIALAGLSTIHARLCNPLSKSLDVMFEKIDKELTVGNALVQLIEIVRGWACLFAEQDAFVQNVNVFSTQIKPILDAIDSLQQANNKRKLIQHRIDNCKRVLYETINT